MNGPEHFKKAEELLRHQPDHTPTVQDSLEAIAHAILALATTQVRLSDRQGAI